MNGSLHYLGVFGRGRRSVSWCFKALPNLPSVQEVPFEVFCVITVARRTLGYIPLILRRTIKQLLLHLY